jgi:hypothetical protein
VDILKIIWLSQGFILPFTRLAEPFFYKIVIKKIKSIQCPCSKSQSSRKEERLNDLTFLNRGIRESDLSEHKVSQSSIGESFESDSSITISDESIYISNSDKEEELEMKPFFLELASSLNVELVYIILKSITQFAFVSATRHS